MMYFQAIDRAIELTEKFLTNDLFQFDLLKDHLTTIIEVGDAVNTSVTSLTPDIREEFMSKISKLAYDIEQLSNKTRDQAVHFKDLRTPFSVYAELFRTANSLSRLMQDTMFYPNAKCIQDFQEALRKTTPLISILNIIDLAVHDLSSERLKMSDDYNNWRNAVDALLTQFLVIDAYSTGIAWNGNRAGPKNLAEKIQDLFEKMDGGSDGRGDHWKRTVEQLVHRTQDNNIHLNNSQKADLLQESLKNMLKNCAFYVVVFNDCDIGEDLAYDGVDSHFVLSMKRGMCNVIIYRSLEWSNANQYQRSNIINQVEVCRHGVLPWWADYRGFPGILRNDHVQNTGFVGMIRKDQDVHVRSVNCEEDGPGYWITALNKGGQDFILVAGYQ